MTRPLKQTVDYFSHDCKHGKTIFVLEERFGKIGYGFWFKLLEELGSNEGHFLDMNDEMTLEFLGAKTGFPTPETLDALNLLAKLNAIDFELWQNKIIWCQKFVDRLGAVYEKRTVSAPEKPPLDGVSGVGNPRSKVKEVKKSKEKTNTSKNSKEFSGLTGNEIKTKKKPKTKNEYGNQVIELWNEFAKQNQLPKVTEKTREKQAQDIQPLKKNYTLDDWQTIFAGLKNDDFQCIERRTKTTLAFLLQRKPGSSEKQYENFFTVGANLKTTKRGGIDYKSFNPEGR